MVTVKDRESFVRRCLPAIEDECVRILCENAGGVVGASWGSAFRCDLSMGLTSVRGLLLPIYTVQVIQFLMFNESSDTIKWQVKLNDFIVCSQETESRSVGAMDAANSPTLSAGDRLDFAATYGAFAIGQLCGVVRTMRPEPQLAVEEDLRQFLGLLRDKNTVMPPEPRLTSAPRNVTIKPSAEPTWLKGGQRRIVVD